MTKEDLGKALSLSCVENYFLTYFKDKFDIRKLFVKSFLPFNKVVSDFCKNNETYENYSLIRIQAVAEILEIIKHDAKNKIEYKNNALNLIRVNKNFFNDSKLLPWREDHYIVFEKQEDNYTFYNNYPLSTGEMSKEKLYEIYDNKTLQYYENNNDNNSLYEKMRETEYHTIIFQTIKHFELEEENIVKFRNVLLVLKTLRKRTIEWLKFESDNERFLLDDNFEKFAKEFIKAYEDIFMKLEISIIRKKPDIENLQEKINIIIDKEKELGLLVKIRRILK